MLDDCNARNILGAFKVVYKTLLSVLEPTGVVVNFFRTLI
jgi:hypothetical protein